MRKKIVFTSLILLFLTAALCFQFSQPPTVSSAITNQSSDGYCSELTIIANKLIIFNKDILQTDLIEHIVNNDFQNMLFSYDVMGYPKEYIVTVYTNDLAKKLGIPAFTFRYAM